jgi:MerR family mercuric resistance operon transcriptional regulator
MTIAGLAQAGGVGVETVRYYQRRGLLETPQRGQGSGAGAVRRYGADAVRRLQFIRAAQTGGFTLEEIAELLRLDSTSDRARARQLAQGRIAALDEKIAELQAARQSLSRLARDCASGGKGPCPIIKAFTG